MSLLLSNYMSAVSEKNIKTMIRKHHELLIFSENCTNQNEPLKILKDSRVQVLKESRIELFLFFVILLERTKGDKRLYDLMNLMIPERGTDKYYMDVEKCLSEMDTILSHNGTCFEIDNREVSDVCERIDEVYMSSDRVGFNKKYLYVLSVTELGFGE